jgi:hypothetical protein
MPHDPLMWLLVSPKSPSTKSSSLFSPSLSPSLFSPSSLSLSPTPSLTNQKHPRQTCRHQRHCVCPSGTLPDSHRPWGLSIRHVLTARLQTSRLSIFPHPACACARRWCRMKDNRCNGSHAEIDLGPAICPLPARHLSSPPPLVWLFDCRCNIENVFF